MMMKGYVVYPMSSYDEKRLFEDGWINVSKIREDALIWVETWYMEDSHVFEIEFDEEDLLEDMHGSAQHPDETIVDVTWWRIKGMVSMKKIGEIVWQEEPDSADRGIAP